MASKKNVKMKAARKAKGLLQVDLAEKVGATRLWLNAVENGKGVPSLDLARKIAKELGTTVDELFPD